ncbi:hypothetical protein FGE12_24980 [Aggregicoccus sp. 17bor-14]|uniref:hypothetical protein n=1 Tax=Myxococcaceae TaxID=31 RepID=UPI00129C33BC|nr:MULTISPECIES: hypothetical protein [Myxococcaceae]MBF5045685.1 hypothetical protein [Simulacricoccus sp. 17bor-14]MRI91422.1 hypothetical protein [Aggregicoccus sp. 17bor-14]
MAPRFLVRALEPVIRALLAHGPHDAVDGFKLFAVPAESRRLVKGLELLRAVDPRRYRRAQRYAHRLIAAHRTDYDTDTGGCFLNRANLDSPLNVAVEVLRLGTYGRFVAGKGVAYKGAWIERLDRIAAHEKFRFLWRHAQRERWDEPSRSAWLREWVDYESRLLLEHRAEKLGTPFSESAYEQRRAAIPQTFLRARDLITAFDTSIDKWHGRH